MMIVVAVWLVSATAAGADAGGFRVYPYLQNPDKQAISVRWLSEKGEPGTLVVTSSQKSEQFRSEPATAPTLAYNPFGQEHADRHATLPFLHSVRITGPVPGG